MCARQHKRGSLLPNREGTDGGATGSDPPFKRVGAPHQCPRVNPKNEVDESSTLTDGPRRPACELDRCLMSGSEEPLRQRAEQGDCIAVSLLEQHHPPYHRRWQGRRRQTEVNVDVRRPFESHKPINIERTSVYK